MLHTGPLGNKAKSPDECHQQQKQVGGHGFVFFSLHPGYDSVCLKKVKSAYHSSSACHESGIPSLSMLEFIDRKINEMNSSRQTVVFIFSDVIPVCCVMVVIRK
jgi:hypothetical protein